MQLRSTYNTLEIKTKTYMISDVHNHNNINIRATVIIR